MNCFKLCNFDRLNTTSLIVVCAEFMLWIALNYVTLTDWIQHYFVLRKTIRVVNCFKLCNFDRLNTTLGKYDNLDSLLWIALNYVTLTDWIQQGQRKGWSIQVVNCFKLCNFDRLNTTHHQQWIISQSVTTKIATKIMYSIYKSGPQKSGLF